MPTELVVGRMVDNNNTASSGGGGGTVLLDTSTFTGELSQQDLDSLVDLNYHTTSNILMTQQVGTSVGLDAALHVMFNKTARNN